MYPKAYDSVSEARASIGRNLAFYATSPSTMRDARTADLTGKQRTECTSPAAANPGHSITEAELHLPQPRNTFRQTVPTLTAINRAAFRRKTPLVWGMSYTGYALLRHHPHRFSCSLSLHPHRDCPAARDIHADLQPSQHYELDFSPDWNPKSIQPVHTML